MKEISTKKIPTSFAAFSPTGYAVMAFATDADAERARQALRDNGFGESDIAFYCHDEIAAEFEKSEQQSFNPLQIGQEIARVDEYLALAKQGRGFLLLHALEEEAAKSAMEIVCRFNLKFAEKYNPLTIEELE
jgi:hypothetical protein